MNDDVLTVLNDNTEDLPKIKDDEQHSEPRLSKSQELARQQGNLEASTGVIRSTWDDVLATKRMASKPKTDFTDLSKGNNGGYYGSPSNEVFGAPNPTDKPGGSFNQDFEDFDPDVLHRDLLGSTAYKELKHAVGIADDESFTDYYNQNKYIPEGYGMEAKLLLAEERRMKEYQKYLAGETSKTDFLYNTYGKDFLKAQGIDLDSSLFWYNRAKKGDHSNPLDNTYIMENVMKASEEAFLQETFVKDTSNMKLKEKLAGITTGVGLSDEQIYDLYKNEFDKMKQFFDDDIHKIITYYKSGNLSNVFNPFIDVDGDNIQDYYLHIDGKMYACKEGSFAKGLAKDQTATVSYDENGNVHQVEINDGLTGWVGALGEGFIGFFSSLVDTTVGLGYSALYGITGGFGKGYSMGNYAEGMMNYDAAKNSIGLLNKDIQVFSGNESAATAWCRGIGMVAGIITEQAILATLTGGIGNAAEAGSKLAVKAAQEATERTVKHSMKQGLKTVLGMAWRPAVGAGIGAAIGAATGEDEGAVAGAAIGATIGGAFGANQLVKGLTATGHKVGAEKVAKGLTNVLQMGGKIRSGIQIGKTPVSKMAFLTGQQFVKDMVNTTLTLSAQNKQLEIIKEENPDFDFPPISDGAIFKRAAIYSLASSAVSFGLRAYGDSTATTRFGQLTNKFSSDETKKNLLNSSFAKLSKENKGAVSLIANVISKHATTFNKIDNLADIVENFITAGIQAAASNPYVRDFSSAADVAFRSALNPQTILMSGWAFLNNKFDIGGGSSIKHDKELAAYKAYAEIGLDTLQGFKKVYGNMLNNGASVERCNAIKTVISSIETKLNDNSNGKDKFGASIEVVQELDKIFNNSNEVDTTELIKGFNVSEEEANIVKDIMASDKQNIGFFSALTIAKEQLKADKDIVEQLNITFEALEAEATQRRNTIEKAAKTSLGNFINKKAAGIMVLKHINQLEQAFTRFENNTDHIAYDKVLGEYKDAFYDIKKSYNGKNADEVAQILLDQIELTSRMKHAGLNIDSKELEAALDKYFTIKTLEQSSFIHKERFFIDKDGKIKTDKLKYTEEEKKQLFNESPILYILSFDPESKAAEAIRQSGLLPKTTRELHTFIENDSMIQTIMFRNDLMNDFSGDQEGQKIKTSLDCIADISELNDEDGNTVFNSQYPFVKRIKYSSSEKTDSGNNKEYEFYIIRPFDGSNDLEKINTIQSVYKTINCIAQLANPEIATKDQKILINELGWLASGIDSIVGIGDPDINNEYYFYKGLDIIMSISDGIDRTRNNKGNSKTRNKFLSTSQVLTMFKNIGITKEDLEKIRDNNVGVFKDESGNEKTIYAFSTAASRKAGDFIKFDNIQEELIKTIELGKALSRKFREAAGANSKKEFKANKKLTDDEQIEIFKDKFNHAKNTYDPTESERKQLSNTYQMIQDPKNKYIIQTIVEEHPEFKNVIEDFQSEEGFLKSINFSQGVAGERTLAAPDIKARELSDEFIKDTVKFLTKDIDDTGYYNYSFSPRKFIVDAIKTKLNNDFKDIYSARQENGIIDDYNNKKVEAIEKINQAYEELKTHIDRGYEFSLARNRSNKEEPLLQYKKLLDEIANKIDFINTNKHIVDTRTNRKNIKTSNGDLVWDVWIAIQNAEVNGNKLSTKEQQLLKDNGFNYLLNRGWIYLNNNEKNKIIDFHDQYRGLVQLDLDEKQLIEDLNIDIKFAKELRVSIEDALADKSYFDNKNKAFAKFKNERQKYLKLKQERQEALNKFNINDSLFHLTKKAGLQNNDERFRLLYQNPTEYFADLKNGIELNVKDSNEKKDLLDSIKLLEQRYSQKNILDGILNSITGEEIAGKDLIKLLKKGNLKARDDLNIKTFILLLSNKTNENFDINKLKNTNGYLHYDGIDLRKALRNFKDLDLESVTLTKETARESAVEMLTNDMLAYRNIYYNNTEVFSSKDVIEINLLELMPKKFSEVLRKATSCSEALNNYKNFNDEASINSLRKAIQKDLNSDELARQERSYLEILSLALSFKNSKSLLFTMPLEEWDSPKGKSLRSMLQKFGYDNNEINSARNHTSNIPGVIFKDKTTRGIKTNIDYDKFVENFINNSNNLDFINRKFKSNPNYEYNLIPFFGINYLSEDTILDLNSEFKVLTSIKNKNKNGLYDIEADDFVSYFKEKTRKDGLAGGALSTIYNLYISGRSVGGKDNKESRTSFIANNLIEALFTYLDPKGKETTYQNKTIILNAGSVKGAKEILDYYKKNPDSLFVPQSEMTKGKEIVFVLNDKLKNSDTADELKQQLIKDFSKEKEFDLKRLVPAFNNTFDNRSEYWKVADIIKNQNIYELRNVNSIVRYAKEKHSMMSLDNSEYESFIKKTSGKTTKEILDLAESFADNYYIKTLGFAIESSLQMSKTVKNDLISLGGESLYKFADYKSCVILGRILDTFEFDGKKYGDLLSSELDPDYRNKVLEGLKKDYIETYNKNNIDLSKDSLLTDPNKSITSLDSLKFKSLHKNIKPEDYSVEDFDNMFKALNFGQDLYIHDIDERVLPEHNGTINMISCLSESDGKLHIDLDYYFSKPISDRASLLKFISEQGNEGKQLAQLLLSKEKEYERISTANGKIYNDFNYIENDDANSRLVIETLSLNTVTTQYQNTIGSFGDGLLSKEQLNTIKNLFKAKGKSYVQAKQYKKLSTLDEINDDTLISPIAKVYADLLNQTLVNRGDKSGSALVYNINSRESMAEMFTSIAYCAKTLEQFKLQQGKNTISLFEGLSQNDIAEIATLMNLYSTGVSRQAEYTGYLFLKIYNEEDAEGNVIKKYSLSPISSSTMNPDDAVITTLLFDTGEIDSNGNMIRRRLTDIMNEKDNDSKHILIKLSKDSFKADNSGFDQDIKLYDLNDEETSYSMIERAAFKAKHDESLKNYGFENRKIINDTNLLVEYYGRKATIHQQYNNVVNTLKNNGVSENMVNLIRPMVQTLLSSNPTSRLKQQVQTTLIKNISNLKEIPTNKELELIRDIVVNGVSKEGLSNEFKNIISKNIKTIRDSEIELETKTNVKDEKGNPVYKNKLYKLEEFTDYIDGYINSNSKKERKNSLINLKKMLSDLNSNPNNAKKIPYIFNKIMEYTMLNRQEGKDLEFLLGSNGKTFKQFFDDMEIKDDFALERFKKFNFKTIEDLFKDGNYTGYDLEWLVRKMPIDADEEDSFNANKLYQIGFIVSDSEVDLTDKSPKGTELSRNGKRYSIIVKQPFKELGYTLDNNKKNNNKIVGSLSSEFSSNAEDDVEGTYRYAGSPENFNKLYKKAILGEGLENGDIVVETYEDAVKLFKEMTNKTKVYIGLNNRKKFVDDDMIRKYMPDFFSNAETIDVLNDFLKEFETSGELSGETRKNLQHLKQRLGLDRTEDNAHNATSDIIDTLNLLQYITKTKINTEGVYKNLYNEFDSIAKEVSGDTSIEYNDLKQIINNFKFNLETPKNQNDLAVIESLRNRDLKKGNSLLHSALSSIRSIINEQEYKIQTKKKNAILRQIINNSISIDEFATVLDDAVAKKEIGSIYYNIFKAVGSAKETDGSVLFDINTTTPQDVKTFLVDIMMPIQASAIREFTKDNLSNIVSKYNIEDPSIIPNDIKMQAFLSSGVENIKKYIFQEANKNQHLIDSIGNLTKDTLNNLVSQNEFNKFRNLEYNARNNMNTLDFTKEGSSEWNKTMFKYSLSVVKPIKEQLDKIDLPDELKYNLLEDLINPVCWTKESQKTFEKMRSSNKANPNAKKAGSNYQEELLKEAFSLLSDHYMDSVLYFMGSSSKGEFRKIDNNVGYGEIRMSSKLFKKAYKNIPLDSIELDENGNHTYYAHAWRQPLQYKNLPIFKIVVTDKADAPLTLSTTTAKALNGDFDGDFFYVSAYDPTNNSDYKTIFESETGSIAKLIDGLLDGTELADDKDLKKYSTTYQYIKKVNNDTNTISIFKNLLNSDNLPESIEEAKEYYTKYLINEMTQPDTGITPEEAVDYADEAWEAYGVKLGYVDTGKKIAVPYSTNPIFKNDSEMRKNLKKVKHNLFLQGSFDSSEVGEVAKVNHSNSHTGKTGNVLNHISIALTKETTRYIDALLKNGNQITIRNNLISGLNKLSDYIDGDKLNGLKDFVINKTLDLTNDNLSASDVKMVIELAENYIYQSKKYNHDITPVLTKQLSNKQTEFVSKYNAIISALKNSGVEIEDIDSNEMTMPAMLANLATNINKYYDNDVFTFINSIKRNGATAPISDVLINLITKADNLNEAGILTAPNRTKVMTNGEVNTFQSKDKRKIFVGTMKVAIPVKRITSDDDSIYVTKYNNASITSFYKAGKENIIDFDKDGLQKLENKTYTGNELNQLLLPKHKFKDEKIYTVTNAEDIVGKEITTNTQLIITSTDNVFDLLDDGNYVKMGNTSSKVAKGTTQKFNATFDNVDDDSLKPELIYTSSILEQKKGSPETSLRPIEENGKIKIIKDDQGNEYQLFEMENMSVVASQLDNKISERDRLLDHLGVMQTSNSAGALVAYGEYFFHLSKNGKAIIYDPKQYKELYHAINSRINRGLSDKNAMHTINFFKIKSLLDLITDEKIKAKAINDLGVKANAMLDEESLLKELYNAGDLGGHYGQSRINRLLNYLYSQGKTAKEINKELQSKNSIYKAVWSEELYKQAHPQTIVSADESNKKNASKNDISTIEPRTASLKDIDPNYERKYSGLFNSASDLNNGFVNASDLVRKITGNDVSKNTFEQLVEMGILKPTIAYNGNRFNDYKPITIKEGIYSKPDTETEALDKKTGGFSSPQISKRIFLEGPTTEILSKSLKDNLSDGYNFGRAEQETYRRTAPYIDNHLYRTADGSALKGINLMLTDETLESKANALTNNTATINGDIAKVNPEIIDGRIELGTIQYLSGERPLEGDESYAQFLRDNLSSQEYVETKQKLKSEDTKTMESYITGSMRMENTIHSGINKYKDSKTKITDMLLKLADDYIGINPSTLKPGNVYKEKVLEALGNEITKDDILRDIELNSNIKDTVLKTDLLETTGIGSDDGTHVNLNRTIQSLNLSSKNYSEVFLGKEFVIVQSLVNNNKELSINLNKWATLKTKIDLIKELEEKKPLILRSKSGVTSYTNMEDRIKVFLGLNPDATHDDILTKQKELINESNDLIKNDAMLKKSTQLVGNIMTRLTAVGNKMNPLKLLQYYLPIGKLPSKKKGFSLGKNVDNPAYHLTSNEMLFKADSLGYAQEESLGLLGNLIRVSNEMAKEITVEKDLHNTLVQDGYIANAQVYHEANKVAESQLSLFYEHEPNENSTRFKKIKSYEETIYNALKRQIFENATNEVAYLEKYKDHHSFEKLLSVLRTRLEDFKTELGFSSAEELFNLRQEHLNDPINRSVYDEAFKLENCYQSCLATIVTLAAESGKVNEKNYVSSLLINGYDIVKSRMGSDYVFVDSKGAIIEPDTINNRGSKIGTYKQRDMNNIVTNMSIGEYVTADEAKAKIYQMMLRGDVYIAKKSTADQLHSKLYTKHIPGSIGKIMQKARNLVVPMIMSTPMQLVDRAINFTLFDAGTLGSCAPGMELYMSDSLATINKLFAVDGNLNDQAIAGDKNMQYLLRYIASSNFNPLEDSMAGGEKLKPSNIPGIKQYLDMVNRTYGKQNLAARFAYFLMMANNAEANNYQIDYTKSGAAYYNQKGIEQIKGNIHNKIYKSMDLDEAKAKASMDTKIAEIIDQNIGSVNGMPYGSKILSQYGLVFTSFPLALMRWGKNSLLSAYSAFGDLKGEGGKYLLNKGLGSALSYSLLLGLQLIFSEDLRDYLFGNKDDDEEPTEEELKNVENILFRGGSIQIFKSLLSGKESTSSGQSRGALASLFDSYIANFIPMLQDEDYDDEKENAFFKGLRTTLQEQLWSKVNPAFKDPIESIPGNRYFQSTSWYEPGDSWLENMQRKWTGYLMGSAQSQSFHDAYQAESYEPNATFINKMVAGLQNAYIEKNINLKEYKSAYKNYRKAFNYIYRYYSVALGDGSKKQRSENYYGLKGELRNALKHGKTPDAIYNIINNAMRNGTSIEEIKSALNSVSIKSMYTNIQNKEEFLRMLSDKEMNIFKFALAYEDSKFPFMDDITQETKQEYYNNRYPKNPDASRNKLKYILKDYINSTRYNDYNKTYNNSYYNFNRAKNYYNNKPYFDNRIIYSPDSTYQYFQNAWKYGMSTDIWGNQYSNYTNSKGDKWKRRKDK